MKHIWSILCQKSSIDTETNLLSIFDCIEEMHIVLDKNKINNDKNIIIPATFQVVSYWTLENSDKNDKLELLMELIDPDGKSLNQINIKQNIKTGIQRLRNRTNINGLPITTEGRYIIKISQKENNKNKIIAELPLDIKISYNLITAKK